MTKFRFQDLEIWQLGCDVGSKLCGIADELEGMRHYLFADQLRRAALSISNNIAEGSGSASARDFQHFLNIARRSVYENASMLLFFQREGHVHATRAQPLLDDLESLSRKIHSFRRSLTPDS